MKACANCDVVKKVAARGLCKACYARHTQAGTLDQFKRTKGENGDAAYRAWLTSDPKVSVDIVRPWAEHLVLLNGGEQARAARDCGVDLETLRRILDGKWQRVCYSVAEEIASAAGRRVELQMAMPEDGVEGWSEFGRYCGDGSSLHPGCGSFHHPASMKGLCAECFAIAVGLSDQETRDVRFTRELAG